MRTKTFRWLSAGAALLALALASPAAAAGPTLRIRGVSVEKKALAKAVERPDAQGHRRAFTEVAVVEIQGDFPPPMDQSLDLFLGDDPIPEYGTSKDGIYFKVYDPALLKRFEGREIRYRVGAEKVRSTGARFALRAAQAPG